MFYVYSKYLRTGKIDYINSYNTEEAAVEKIASCYKIDEKLGQLGQYYYYIKCR